MRLIVLMVSSQLDVRKKHHFISKASVWAENRGILIIHGLDVYEDPKITQITLSIEIKI